MANSAATRLNRTACRDEDAPFACEQMKRFAREAPVRLEAAARHGAVLSYRRRSCHHATASNGTMTTTVMTTGHIGEIRVAFR